MARNRGPARRLRWGMLTLDGRLLVAPRGGATSLADAPRPKGTLQADIDALGGHGEIEVTPQHRAVLGLLHENKASRFNPRRFRHRPVGGHLWSSPRA